MSEQFRLEELGTTKATVKRRFFADYERPNDDQWSNRVKAMLTSRRTEFTLDELEDLIAVLDTSHHQCVLDNTDDFHRLTVATHIRLQQRLDRMQGYIDQRRQADAPKAVA